FAATQQVANPRSDKGNDSSADGSSSSSDALIQMKGVTMKPLAACIAKEVRIIDSELPEYPDIKAKYKFYGLGWMSEAPGHYYPTMADKFYVNYTVVLEEKELIVLWLARVAVELKKAQNDILKLKQERQPLEFSLVEYEELEDDAPFIDLLGE
ncbi:hypothetical protein HAX54_046237, partial [Datura stramonium]|nr:hypothetical protein [Datura stramonium]